MPFSRNDRLARPWVQAGTPGLEHRIGGLEKEDGTGNISYDDQNHAKMTRLRHDKVIGIRETIPTPGVHGAAKGELLVLGWGSTYGSIRSAVDQAQRDGHSVSSTHLRYIWPLAKGLEEIFSSYKAVLVPELNAGQLIKVLRSEYPGINFISYPKVEGKPFTTGELVDRINRVLEN